VGPDKPVLVLREIAQRPGETMQKNTAKPKAKCKNCEGKGLLKQGNKKVKCQRCGGTGFKS
jgi:DnaJ-class molecular chaperone